MVRSWLFIALVVGCYSARPPAGAPCAGDGSCPAGLVCSPATQTCEGSAVTAGDAPRWTADACIPAPEICGDGIDQDCDGSDPPCPPNDTASGAIDVTMGGTFTADLRYAHDDASSGNNFCGGSGGRDVFYKVRLTSAQTYYFDTFDSDFDTVIRVYHGSCVEGAAPGNTSCHDDNCNTMQSQGVWNLGGGTSCIEIDQKSSAVTAGALTLHVEPGHRAGKSIALGTAVDGNTATADDDQSTATAGATCSAEPAPDDDYYFALCPGSDATLTATTCGSAGSGSAFVSEVYVVGPTGQLACAECDTSVGAGEPATAHVVGPHLYWIVVDGVAAGSDGPYELDTMIQ